MPFRTISVLVLAAGAGLIGGCGYGDHDHYSRSDYRDYRGGDYAAAEQWFAAAEQANDHDARYPYFLGLARLAQGRRVAAVADFGRGAALERQNLPNAAEVDRALEAVPRDARLMIGRYRP